MYIYLVRHGETDWNVQRRTQGIHDIPLTYKGINQANELAECLVKESISHIYSSPLERAYITASIIAEQIGLAPVKRNELQEVNFGVWEGLTHQQIEEKYPGQIALFRKDFSFFPENGESLYALEKRIDCFINYLQIKHINENDKILVVSHAYPIRMMIIKLMKLPIQHLWDFRIDNTGISIIQIQSDNRRIICLNDTCHLNKLEVEEFGVCRK